MESFKAFTSSVHAKLQIPPPLSLCYTYKAGMDIVQLYRVEGKETSGVARDESPWYRNGVDAFQYGDVMLEQGYWSCYWVVARFFPSGTNEAARPGKDKPTRQRLETAISDALAYLAKVEDGEVSTSQAKFVRMALQRASEQFSGEAA